MQYERYDRPQQRPLTPYDVREIARQVVKEEDKKVRKVYFEDLTWPLKVLIIIMALIGLLWCAGFTIGFFSALGA